MMSASGAIPTNLGAERLHARTSAVASGNRSDVSAVSIIVVLIRCPLVNLHLRPFCPISKILRDLTCCCLGLIPYPQDSRTTVRILKIFVGPIYARINNADDDILPGIGGIAFPYLIRGR